MEVGPVFGLNIGDLLEIYDPSSQSWKMSGCLFTGDYAKSSGALPKSGIMLNGQIYEQATWVHRTDGKGYGLWPTPMTRGLLGGSGSREMIQSKILAGDISEAEGVGMMGVKTKFPTPTTQDHRETDGQMRPSRIATGRKTEYLNRTVKAMEKFPTPTTRDHKDGTAESCQNVPANGLLGREIHKNAKLKGGQLNPQWVDWLMGYPVGWTDLMGSEIQLSLR